MNKDDLKWYFKKDEEKSYFLYELDRMRNIEKNFMEEYLGEEKLKEIYDYSKKHGIDFEQRYNNEFKIIRLLRIELVKKLMREHLNE